MGFLAICNHTDYTREPTMVFLYFYSNRGWTRESTIWFLDICITQYGPESLP